MATKTKPKADQNGVHPKAASLPEPTADEINETAPAPPAAPVPPKPRGLPPMTEAKSVVVELPSHPVADHVYLPTHLAIRLTPRMARALKAVSLGADRDRLTIANGQRITSESPGHITRAAQLIVERIADAMESV